MPGSNVDVLVIEDEAAQALMLESSLTEIGACVSIAFTATDGAARAVLEKPGIIVLDLQFPDGSGLDLLASWSEKGLPAPVIVFSARDDEKERQEALALGAVEYLVKPINWAYFESRVRALAEMVRQQVDPSEPSEAFSRESGYVRKIGLESIAL